MPQLNSIDEGMSLRSAQVAMARSGHTSAWLLSVLALGTLLSTLMPGSASAANFSFSSSASSAQSLSASQTGTITATGSLSVSGSAVAVTVNGNNATLTNLGTLKQTGTGRAIRDNTGVTGLTITNGSSTNSSALMQTADADVIQMNKASSSITLYNYGTIQSLNASKGGSQALDFTAMTGSNVVYNFATGVIEAKDADAIRTGLNGVINNYGLIISTVTTDTGSDGIDAQNNSGLTVNNYSGGSIIGARHGITGGAASSSDTFTATVNNAGTITGNNGSGINIDGYNAKQTATIVNSGTITGNGVTGDGDGIDVDGLAYITNYGTILSVNSYSSTGIAQSEGITIGGGTILNYGTIEGDVAAGNTSALGRGITLAGVDTSGTAEAIYANSIISNYGVIKGQTDSAIVVEGPASGFTVTINNYAGGSLIGGSSSYAAVRTGSDNDTVNNAGTINGSSSGKAIDLGAGNNTLNITGGSAIVLGDISGGTGGTNTMTINPGSGNSFTYAYSISNFSVVNVQSGTVTLSGISTYTGDTLLSGGTLILDGSDLLSSSSALVLDGGTLKITNAAGVDAQTFASLTLTNDSIIDLGASSLTFNSLGSIASDATLTVLGFYASTTASYAVSFLGDYTSNADFKTLIAAMTIDGQAATYSFDGTYTNVWAVPLPAAVWLLLSGLGGLGLVRRRAPTLVAA